MTEFVVVRLMELLLVGLLRDETFEVKAPSSGLLAGLADPVIARALAALHGDIARPWTTSVLARLCGTCRSGFSTHFKRVVGVAPMTYLHRWRMAVARDELRKGRLAIGEIALLVGFRSGSAFSTAFSRVVGCSPTRFAA
ncbi:AraC family transcriptional regulator [Hyphomicrobiales bacterium BP6-180914]|uniref:AraC family transcriptional regulator n=1 Tax=Lichenifustis flavocetrariae TaxID=2949735 RepID=A0AA42CP44_9HYPH|nr:AraC family transcriptional regulator [Lichenifustis flavocetrariae]